jgi:CheY-like chemotaxis protein
MGEARGRTPPRHRILIIDDDAISANIHATVLERAGFEVVIREAAALDSLERVIERVLPPTLKRGA